jgi:beta-glucanase (GH16 family)
VKPKLLSLCVALFLCTASSAAPAESPAYAQGKLTHLVLTAAPRTNDPVLTEPQPFGVPGRWRLRFDDEFSAGALNLTKWEPNWLGATSRSVTHSDNRFDLNCMDPRQVRQARGRLALHADARTCDATGGKTFPYTSGIVDTRTAFRFTYGYMEARIYIPATSTGAAANFPAFWADGKGTWPTTGELDVMEVLGSCGLSWHFHSTAGAFGGCTPMAPSTGWHTVGANWQAGSVTYYYDGRQVGRLTNGITSSPMYLILNNSVDPTWGGPTMAPADVQVDYVRVWQ